MKLNATEQTENVWTWLRVLCAHSYSVRSKGVGEFQSNKTFMACRWNCLKMCVKALHVATAMLVLKHHCDGSQEKFCGRGNALLRTQQTAQPPSRAGAEFPPGLPKLFRNWIQSSSSNTDTVTRHMRPYYMMLYLWAN